MSVAGANGANNGLRSTTHLSNPVGCTKLVWAKFASSSTSYDPIFAALNSGATAYNQLYMGNGSAQLSVSTASGGTAFGSQPTFTDWTCYAMTAGAAGAGSLIGYWQDNAGGGWTTASTTGASFTNAYDYIMTTGSNLPVAATYAYYMEWNVVLTLAQLNAQFLSATPTILLGNLSRYLPLTAATGAGTDSSGNGFNMSIVGSLTNGASNPTFPSNLTGVGASGSLGVMQIGGSTAHAYGASGSIGVAMPSSRSVLGSGSGSRGVANIVGLVSPPEHLFCVGKSGSLGIASLVAYGVSPGGGGITGPPRLPAVFDTRSFILQALARNFTVSAMQLFPTKDPGESLDLTFDFSTNLPAGVSLNGSITVNVTVLEGTDASPSAILNGSASVDSTGLRVIQPVIGGLSGVLYEIKVTAASTISTIILVLAGALPVRSAQ